MSEWLPAMRNSWQDLPTDILPLSKKEMEYPLKWWENRTKEINRPKAEEAL